MLHILLTILKVLGIVLFVLLALLIFLLLIVLFIPIRYSLNALKEADTINGKVRVSWLFGLLTFIVKYEDKSIIYKFRVLGIDILKLLKLLSKPKKSKPISNSNKENKKDTKKDTGQDDKEVKSSENVNKTVDEEKTSIDTDKSKEKIKLSQKVKNGIQKIKSSITNLKLTIKSIYDKIKYWKNFISDQKTKDALIYVKKHLIKLVKHIMPKKIKGTITYGFDDPCKTGQILAGVSMFYPLYYKSLTLYPNFSESVLNGHVHFKGSVYVILFVKTGLQIFLNKNIQFIIHNFRNKEAS